jgi:hypothetical protein
VKAHEVLSESASKREKREKRISGSSDIEKSCASVAAMCSNLVQHGTEKVSPRCLAAADVAAVN